MLRGPLQRRGQPRPGAGAWRQVEVYASFMKLTGAFEIAPPERFSDAVNRHEDFLVLRGTRAEPLAMHYPVPERVEEETTISKAAVILVCPMDDEGRERDADLFEERATQTAAINTVAFSLIADVHLPVRTTLQDHLERSPHGFLPVTQVSALCLLTPEGEAHSVQRAFALLNPSTILSFSMR